MDLSFPQQFDGLPAVCDHVHGNAQVPQSLRRLVDLHGISPANAPQMGPNKKQDSHRPRIYANGGTFDKTKKAMAFPKFLVGDNTDQPESVYIIHTEYPRFILDLDTDEIEWLDDLESENEEETTSEMAALIEQAETFYQREVDRYEAME
jgi:hypothetical protein